MQSKCVLNHRRLLMVSVSGSQNILRNKGHDVIIADMMDIDAADASRRTDCRKVVAHSLSHVVLDVTDVAQIAAAALSLIAPKTSRCTDQQRRHSARSLA